MESFKDMWASLIAHVNERTTNPLTFAFALSWSLWNYKFFVLLFSDLSPAERFAAIDALYPKPQTFLEGGFLYPLAAALAYVFVYTFFTEWVVTFYRRRQVKIANALKLVEGNRIRTVEEVTRLVRRHEKDLKSAVDEVGESRTEIEELRAALAASEAEVAKAKAEIEKFVFNQGDEVSAAYDRTVDNPMPLTPANPATAITGQEILSPTDAAKVWTANGVDLSERKLKILTLLTQDRFFYPSKIGERLKLAQFWVDSELEELERLRFVESLTSGQRGITKRGRDTLTAFIKAGFWEIPESYRSD